MIEYDCPNAIGSEQSIYNIRYFTILLCFVHTAQDNNVQPLTEKYFDWEVAQRHQQEDLDELPLNPGTA